MNRNENAKWIIASLLPKVVNTNQSRHALRQEHGPTYGQHPWLPEADPGCCKSTKDDFYKVTEVT